MKKNIAKLSGGQQQRLNILLSVIHQPQLVILDEVSTGLDIAVKEVIF
ncbi:ATP-binding cassette domain-containing protein [Spiroplasma poulsonii]|nr:ATP-binding cassette domain-containing protein [Spiroplasma poulsonii]